MTPSEYAEAWVRRNYRFNPDEEPVVKVLIEYLLIRNEPLHYQSWYLPGPEEKRQWKAQARMFVNECIHHKIQEKNFGACLRSVIERYRREHKGDPPKNLYPLVCLIGEYESPEEETEMWRDQFRKYTAPETKEWPHDY